MAQTEIEDAAALLVERELSAIPEDQCTLGSAYVGSSKGIGDLAVYADRDGSGAAFWGLYHGMYGTDLVPEFHIAYDKRFGSFTPFRELDSQPPQDKDALMTWLLDGQIELTSALLASLENSPEPVDPVRIEEVRRDLEQQLAIKANGFERQPLTPADIKENIRRRAAEQASQEPASDELSKTGQ